MTTTRQKTVLRTFRLSEELSDLIDKEASQRKSSANSVVNSILIKYFQWDSYARRFGFVSITKETFRGLIVGYDENELMEIAREVTAQALRDFMSFRFERQSIRSFLDCIELITDYGYLGELEIRNNGPLYKIHLVHSLGKEVSIFIGYVFQGLLREIAGVESDFKSSGNQVEFNFVANE